MDFQQMLSRQSHSAPTESRELWASLTRARGYGYLRDVQAQVLTAWDARRNERDLVVKVNTGGGKTIDGLVILQSYLNAGAGPGLYVAPNKYLEAQVRREAANLGLAASNAVGGPFGMLRVEDDVATLAAVFVPFA